MPPMTDRIVPLDPTTRRRALATLCALGAGLAMPARASNEITRWPAGRAAPSLVAEDLDGKHWRLAELRGRAVLLNFWASWCEPCRTEMPSLQSLAEFNGPDRLVVLAINFKESAAQAGRFVQRAGIRLPVLRDPEGAIARAWDVRVFPTTILVGSDGTPRQRIRGEVDWSSPEADKLVSALLAPG